MVLYDNILICTLSIFILSIIVLSYLLVKQLKPRNNRSHIKLLYNLDKQFFYYKDQKHNQEFISEPLKKLLNIPSNLNSFENIISKINDKYKKTAQELYTNLCNGSVPNFDNINSIYTVIVTNSAQHKVALGLSCMMQEETPGQFKGFLIKFYNIQKTIANISALEFENKSIRKDLANKNKILNSLPFPVWLRNPNLDIIYFNSKFSQIISEKTKYELDTIDINQNERKLALKAKQTSVLQEEEKHLIVNGQRKLYHFQQIPTFDNWILGIAYDVTSKGKVLAELDRHISAQSDLLESTSSAIAIYDSDTKINFFNQAFVKLWEFDEKWLLSQPTYGQILDVLRQERKLPEQMNFQQFKKEQLDLFTNVVSTHNDFFYLPDGRALRIIVIQHAFGGLLFSYEDMTDRLALERSYKTLTAVQKETIDNLNEGILVVNESGKITISNAKFTQMWQINPKEMTPEIHINELLQKMHILMHKHKDWLQFKEHFIYLINIRKTKNIKIFRDDESTLDMLFAPLPDGATLVSFHDITDSILVEKSLMEKNQALQEADKLKTEFLANISYELRSPLTSIIGFSESLSKKYFGVLNDRQKEYIEFINNSSRYLMGLINDILDLASIDAGYMELEISKFDIYSALDGLVLLIRERIRENKLSFRFYCNKDIGYMFGDVLRIKQVIFKLVSNAIERSKEEGVIKLKVQKIKNKNIYFIVEDNGHTINLTDQKKIFEKFAHIENKRGSKKAHSGLGLAIVKSFIELHGGSVKFQSQQKGNQFICSIPLDNPELIMKYNMASVSITTDDRSKILA